MIQLSAAAVSYEVAGRALVDAFAVCLGDGRLTVLMGPNGAGKSTALKLLCGELAATRGTVKLNDTPVRDWRAGPLARAVAVLRQDSDLQFPFRVHEVVALGRTPHRTGRRRDDAIVDEVIGRLGIDDLADREFTTLSGGEKQRVQIARVLAQAWGPEPAALLLDEPTSALDLAHQFAVMDIVRERTRQGGAALVIMHDLNLAAQYADDLVLLREGKTVAHGGAGEVLTEANLASAFRVPVHVVSDDNAVVLIPRPGPVGAAPPIEQR